MIILSIIIPLLIAGIIRVFTDKFALLKIPLDFGLNIWGKNKTWQGLIIMCFTTFVVGLIFKTNLPYFYGFILGLAYSLGELINSSIKRFFLIKPGGNVSKPWIFFQYIFDQIDSTLAISFVLFIWNFNALEIFYCFSIGSLLHFFVDSINHIFGSKKQSDKIAIIYFYQIIFYFIFSLLKLFSSSNTILIRQKSNVILTSNHPFFFDSLYMLRSLGLGNFLNFAPFRFLIAEKYMKNWYGKILELVGAISTRESKDYQPRPLTILTTAINQGFNTLICYEGKITVHKLPAQELKRGIWVLFKESQKSIVYPAKIDLDKKIRVSFKLPINYSTEFADQSQLFLKEINDKVYST